MNMTSSNPHRIEVITSVERRRRWAPAEKKAVVDETYQPGMSVSYVARKHGISPSQVFYWRRRMEDGALTGIGSEEKVVARRSPDNRDIRTPSSTRPPLTVCGKVAIQVEDECFNGTV